jgi:hypothetical protein
MSGSDEDEIRKWLEKKGATKCPPRAAAVLGEASPGWRRERERKAEHAQSDRARKRANKARSGLVGPTKGVDPNHRINL